MSDFSKLCVHTITTKPWSIEQAMDKYAEAGIGGVTVWRQWLEGRDVAKVGQELRDRKLDIVSLCRGGFFPSVSADARKQAIQENTEALHEAAELGAPMIVLVVGADPGQSLQVSRDQIVSGIEAVLPLAEEYNVKLAIEPLHPMYADDRSAINTMASANEVCDRIGHPLVGIAADVYHIWWDPDLAEQIKLTAEKERMFAFHICDWLTPTKDFLNDRGLMGEGCIPIAEIRDMVRATGFEGYDEVEVFSDRWWAEDQDVFLEAIKKSYLEI